LIGPCGYYRRDYWSTKGDSLSLPVSGDVSPNLLAWLSRLLATRFSEREQGRLGSGSAQFEKKMVRYRLIDPKQRTTSALPIGQAIEYSALTRINATNHWMRVS
jgi:hypothetical protein